MATRIVQGTLKAADGSAITGDVHFLIQSGYTDSGTEVIGKQQVEAKTDSLGAFSIELHSGENVAYLCTLPTLERFTFDLPNSASPLDIITVR